MVMPKAECMVCSQAVELKAILDELWDRVDELKEASVKSDAAFNRMAHIRDEIKEAMGALGQAEQQAQQACALALCAWP